MKTGRCPTCAGDRERSRRPAWVTRFYSSSAWKKLRAMKRAANPLCENCVAEGHGDPTEQIDHVIPLEERPDLCLVWDNLRALCVQHHDAKTKAGR